VKALTVRQIVAELCKFNASSTLCWDLLKQTEVKSSADQLDTAMHLNGALQQVFARCAQPVWRKVEEVVVSEAEKSGVTAVPTPVPPTTPPAALIPAAAHLQGLKADLVDFLKLNSLEESGSLLQALREMEISSMATVRAALKGGGLTLEELTTNGSKKAPAMQFLDAARTVRIGRVF
jgi:hypothetical protein